jgi:hypothetical protein
MASKPILAAVLRERKAAIYDLTISGKEFEIKNEA